MSSPRRPPRRLPARVYWVRRAVVLTALATVSALVLLGVTSLLGTDDPVSARQAAAPTAPTAPASSGEPAASGRAAQDEPSSAASVDPSTLSKKERRARRSAERREQARADARMAVPQGECEPRTVRISSRVSDAFAATDIEVPLDVVTLGADACTWTFSPGTAALDITSGDDRVWSSVECPRALPTEELVLVPGESSSVSVTWNGQRSDADCSPAARFAYPGWYHVLVAAEGGEPYDQQFELTKAPDEVRTRTPQPRPEADPSARAEAQTGGDPEGRTQSSGRDGD